MGILKDQSPASSLLILRKVNTELIITKNMLKSQNGKGIEISWVKNWK